MKLEWTILLLRPDYTAASYGTDTYLAQITATTSGKALALARRGACEGDGNGPECRKDYYCLFCTRGTHIDLSDGNGGVI